MADKKYKLLDLFSGIGGFSLGLERSGAFQTVAFCEIEPFCRSVLKKHWPEVPVYEDVKLLSAERLGSDGISVDAICGGFPCQDISVAGRGAGLAGGRSGLWFEYHRLIKEIRPKVAIIENVSALRSRGLDQVLWSLAEIGYDAEWHCIPASAVGAPHQRDRIWIVAYPQELFQYGSDVDAKVSSASASQLGDSRCENIMAHANDEHGWSQSQISSGERTGAWGQLGGGCGDVAYPNNSGCFKQWGAFAIQSQQSSIKCSSWWSVEPNVGRVANGVPARVDRLRSLGNAVVPQIPEMIGRAIISFEGQNEDHN
jgi:DNA (cytosine-5)-methyltransferase 1